ncbi:Carn-acyltransf domain-containing protein [Aphelenchoides fujianensis]|nr:Carn-acyltransf domain-containing protein [Aphelenchoides fujianensis]
MGGRKWLASERMAWISPVQWIQSLSTLQANPIAIDSRLLKGPQGGRLPFGSAVQTDVCATRCNGRRLSKQGAPALVASRSKAMAVGEKSKRKVKAPFSFDYKYPSKFDRLLNRVYNEIFDQLYPVRPLVFAGTFACVSAYFHQHPALVPARLAFFGLGPAAVGLLTAALPVVFLRLFLWLFFFRYRGHLHEPPAKRSLTTRFWQLCFFVLKKYAPPRLLTCNRLLPKQPVPTLHATLLQYLVTMDPICEQEDFVNMQSLVPRFLCVDGPKIQAKGENLRLVYLKRRDPLLINSSVVSVDFVKTPDCSQARRAANIAYLTTLQMLAFGDGSMSPPANGLMYSGHYTRLFANCRVPGREIDRWEPREFARHVVVFSNGRFFRVEMFDRQTDRIRGLDELTEVMAEILERKDEPTAAERKVAAFAHDRRDRWAENRERFFLQNEVNAKFLEQIESSIFCLVLDDAEHYGYGGDDDVLSTFTRDILTGDGTNRWPDKPMNIIVARNGRAAACSEHSFADGPEYVHFMENLFGTEEHFLNTTGEANRIVVPRAGPSVGRAIGAGNKRRGGRTEDREEEIVCSQMGAEATRCYEEYIRQRKDVDLASMVFDEWGKGRIKGAKLPPDAFFQMAIQLAFFKDRHEFVPTYEAAAARGFDYSRTETIRTVSRRSCAFVCAMLEEERDKKQCIEMLQAACKTHQERSRRAMTGQGADRHLFVLYVISKRMGIENAFLDDYIGREWTLSTTQTPYLTGIMDEDNGSDREKWLGGAFGAVKKDGYGIAYHFMGNGAIVFHISSFHVAHSTSSFRLRSLLAESLREMMELFS